MGRDLGVVSRQTGSGICRGPLDFQAMKPHQALKLLKRSVAGSGVLGILLPPFAYVTFQNEPSPDIPVSAAIGFTLMVSSVVHLSYIRRLERALAQAKPANG